MVSLLGDRLLTLRKAHGLTQNEFSEQINKRYPEAKLNKALVSRYENNITKPLRFSLVKEIADFYGVTTDYLMGRSEIRVNEEIKYKIIPVLKTITPEVPIISQEDIIDYEYLPPDSEIDFCLKIAGDSMIGARIYKDDIVFAKQQDMVDNGEIAVVQINNEEAILKRVYTSYRKIVLHSDNPTIPDIILKSSDKYSLRILGKVLYIKFKAR